MDANTITIYRSHDTLRVVKGEHKPHAGSKAQRVTVYPNAQLAFASETDAAARAIIQRVEPSINADVVAKFVPARKRKIVVEIQQAMGVGCTCPDDLLLESRFSETCLVHGKGVTATYEFQMYDILQSCNGPADRPWLDFETIKDEETAREAVRLVRVAQWDGKPLKFRIVRYQMGVGNVPVLE